MLAIAASVLVTTAALVTRDTRRFSDDLQAIAVDAKGEFYGSVRHEAFDGATHTARVACGKHEMDTFSHLVARGINESTVVRFTATTWYDDRFATPVSCTLHHCVGEGATAVVYSANLGPALLADPHAFFGLKIHRSIQILPNRHKRLQDFISGNFAHRIPQLADDFSACLKYGGEAFVQQYALGSVEVPPSGEGSYTEIMELLADYAELGDYENEDYVDAGNGYSKADSLKAALLVKYTGMTLASAMYFLTSYELYWEDIHLEQVMYPRNIHEASPPARMRLVDASSVQDLYKDGIEFQISTFKQYATRLMELMLSRDAKGKQAVLVALGSDDNMVRDFAKGGSYHFIAELMNNDIKRLIRKLEEAKDKHEFLNALYSIWRKFKEDL